MKVTVIWQDASWFYIECDKMFILYYARLNYGPRVAYYPCQLSTRSRGRLLNCMHHCGCRIQVNQMCPHCAHFKWGQRTGVVQIHFTSQTNLSVSLWPTARHTTQGLAYRPNTPTNQAVFYIWHNRCNRDTRCVTSTVSNTLATYTTKQCKVILLMLPVTV